MKTANLDQIKIKFQIGFRVNSYYGNGQFIGIKEVTRVSESSCWMNGMRKSWTSIQEFYNIGLYKELS